jgi:hypothetical protein
MKLFYFFWFIVHHLLTVGVHPSASVSLIQMRASSGLKMLSVEFEHEKNTGIAGS